MVKNNFNHRRHQLPPPPTPFPTPPLMRITYCILLFNIDVHNEKMTDAIAHSYYNVVRQA